MQEIVLPPLSEPNDIIEQLEKEIRDTLLKTIYIPLMKELKQPKKTLQNALEDIHQAVASGQIQFYRGRFSGRFNSAVSRELKRLGAVWDRKTGSYSIPLSELPIELRSSIAASEIRMQKTLEKISKRIGDLNPAEIAGQVKIEKLFDTAIYRVNKSFESNVKKLTVAPQLTKEARDLISKNYTDNLKLYIKKFTEEETTRLREEIQKSTYAGNRYESMVKTIQASYNVSENKAKFLARQETNLLITNFHESRCRDVGSQEYIWTNVVGSPKHPVRPRHKQLGGTRQKWDSPPIMDDGKPKHPGQDYGCRCKARAIIKF